MKKLLSEWLLFLYNFAGMCMRALGINDKYRFYRMLIGLILFVTLFVDLGGWNQAIFTLLISIIVLLEAFTIAKNYKLESKSLTRMHDLLEWKRSFLRSIFGIGIFIFLFLFFQANRVAFPDLQIEVNTSVFIIPVFLFQIFHEYRFDDYYILEQGLYNSKSGNVFPWDYFEDVQFEETEISMFIKCYKNCDLLYNLKLDDKNKAEIPKVSEFIQSLSS